MDFAFIWCLHINCLLMGFSPTAPVSAGQNQYVGRENLGGEYKQRLMTTEGHSGELFRLGPVAG